MKPLQAVLDLFPCFLYHRLIDGVSDMSDLLLQVDDSYLYLIHDIFNITPKKGIHSSDIC